MEKELKLNENQQINHIQSYYFLKRQYSLNKSKRWLGW